VAILEITTEQVLKVLRKGVVRKLSTHTKRISTRVLDFAVSGILVKPCHRLQPCAMLFMSKAKKYTYSYFYLSTYVSQNTPQGDLVERDHTTLHMFVQLKADINVSQ